MPTCMLSRFSCVWLFASLRTEAHQPPLSMTSPGKHTGVGSRSLLQGLFRARGWTLFSGTSGMAGWSAPAEPPGKPLSSQVSAQHPASHHQQVKGQTRCPSLSGNYRPEVNYLSSFMSYLYFPANLVKLVFLLGVLSFPLFWLDLHYLILLIMLFQSLNFIYVALPSLWTLNS